MTNKLRICSSGMNVSGLLDLLWEGLKMGFYCEEMLRRSRLLVFYFKLAPGLLKLNHY